MNNTISLYTITQVSEDTLLILFPNAETEGDLLNVCHWLSLTNRRVVQAFNTPNKRFITDTVQAYRSLTVYFDFIHISSPKIIKDITNILQNVLEKNPLQQRFSGKTVTIPVCYAPEFALDLDRLCKIHKLSEEEFIHIHTQKPYTVCALGFLPGFPYLGFVDDRIATPRLTSPRTSIPAGSVGIADNQTGMYPKQSPGGWNIIGQTPEVIAVVDKFAPKLEVGDQVQFIPITLTEFKKLKGSRG
ncbi:5-oxoprolinase subunit PxpB [Teredinibacter sp. KSP-S5-2]|uniref:5-oxoprolinase subunit PxpB n=1 Tax=Teredinibacter sp. KSP-S5-2 TaxID=3034506 RepID=UPI0029347207|nr:5-oxoprolinase subunit PxpB [Teredinibacter sp. KSP-S5-2]WNO08754.1 5-oxoprolinase subunit PxpB [Teredinibacter sp. KSP-S5-2]